MQPEHVPLTAEELEEIEVYLQADPSSWYGQAGQAFKVRRLIADLEYTKGSGMLLRLIADLEYAKGSGMLLSMAKQRDKAMGERNRLLRVIRAQEAWAQHADDCGGWCCQDNSCDTGQLLWIELQSAKKEAGL